MELFSSKTKNIKYKASLKILDLAKKISNIPIVAIGGIKQNNYKKLLLNNANFLAISGYIWNNKKLTPKEAIEKIDMKISGNEIKPGMLIEHKEDLWEVLKNTTCKA